MTKYYGYFSLGNFSCHRAYYSNRRAQCSQYCFHHSQLDKRSIILALTIMIDIGVIGNIIYYF